ncbi:MAG TPA: LPS assembly protein LptD [Gammaproteobacteria bacterium]|nr:LPS assembly protein LptD [Gammaproteobacteria bacterium]
MSAKIRSLVCCLAFLLGWPVAALSSPPLAFPANSLAAALGWVPSDDNACGGYYLEQPFATPISMSGKPSDSNTLEIASDQTLFSQRSTSVLEGKVSLTRLGQQLTSNKAFLYRDPATGKLSTIDMVGNVHLREPNTLIVANRGHYDFVTKHKTLMEIFYRTALNGHSIVGPAVSKADMQKPRRITSMTAWGRAYQLTQTEPQIYELQRASFSTCPPTHPAWRVKGSHIVLNKITGRGYATNARIYVKSMPVFYFPYLNFSIDHQRKSGFLWPTVGGSNSSGPYLMTPFYWNLAPNYDTTITPAFLSKRGLQINDQSRYLDTVGTGTINFSVLPSDKLFESFKSSAVSRFGGPAIQSSATAAQTTPQTIQAELNRLLNSSTTRKSFAWRDDSRYTPNWSSHVDFNYAGDDYYLRDFGTDLNEITQNQLLQEGDLYYKGENWNFTGRAQTYETLHPIDEPVVSNQYRRAPQLIFNGDYPNQALGLEYFADNEVTHFDIRNTPGTSANQPIGNRINVQPGISLPVYTPSFFINPRVQVAMTDYNLYETGPTNTPTNRQRVIPIFDFASGMSFIRNLTLFSHPFGQTLEPQVYYTYIPYRNQASIPIFDTTVNTLTYDQIFNYNRFSGLDRIGDANQVGFGVSSRFIDQTSGLEKVRLGVGEIVYFANRNVTLCNDSSCSDNPQNPSNHYRLSPVSGLFNYNMNADWGLNTNAIWNPITKQLDNTTMTLHYQRDPLRIINVGYGFVRNGDDVLSGVSVNSSENNLKLTDLSASWPISPDVSALGRWSQNWDQHHLQNLIYGLQYDTCCWAVRLVGGRAFTNFDPTQNNKPQYNSEFYIQFALKGLGNVGSGSPAGLLTSISGYNPQFG